MIKDKISSSTNKNARNIRLEHSKANREGLRSIISTVLILIMAPVLALLITAYVFQSYEVDGPSMENTLQNQDRLIVWKFGHTLAKISNKDYIPERGKIIVFTKHDMKDNKGKEKQLIKRVIALPGEKITVVDGLITVYNKEHPNGFNPDKILDIEDTILGKEDKEDVSFSVGDGEVFVIGDHRNNSYDSRAFGPIPSSDIVGTLSSRILPLSSAKKF